MEIRELNYFLAVAREQSISKAAEALYITQPSLSRQMRHLEEEVGKPLFLRGSRRITLTEAGTLLKKRAEEILALYDKTRAEIGTRSDVLSGEVHIGSGESYAFEEIARAAGRIQERSPEVVFHFYSGDTQDVAERLDKGLLDFGILVEPADVSGYRSLRLRQKDTWGVLMRKDSPLARKDCIAPEDLAGQPLIRSKHAVNATELSDWFCCGKEPPRIVATYNLIYNASILVREGLGYAVGLDKIINTSGDSELCFRPLQPPFHSSLLVVWKQNQVFSAASRAFLEELRQEIGRQEG